MDRMMIFPEKQTSPAEKCRFYLQMIVADSLLFLYIVVY